MKSLTAFIVVCLSLPVLAPNLPAQAASDPVASVSAVTNATASLVPGVSGYVLDDKHKLSAGDKLSFQITEDRDPPKSLMVTDSGELDVPYVGRVVVADKTCLQLAQELKALLEKEYYYRASVVIGLDAASKVRGKVYILGQVRNQGAIEIPAAENFTAGKAILRAGGFGDFADKKRVKVVRNTPEGGKSEFMLNMIDILEKGKTELDVPLQEGDFIIIPSRLINF